MSRKTALKQPKSIVKFCDSCSVELQLSSDDRVGVICDLNMRVHISSLYWNVCDYPGKLK